MMEPLNREGAKDAKRERRRGGKRAVSTIPRLFISHCVFFASFAPSRLVFDQIADE